MAIGPRQKCALYPGNKRTSATPVAVMVCGVHLDREGQPLATVVNLDDAELPVREPENPDDPDGAARLAAYLSPVVQLAPELLAEVANPEPVAPSFLPQYKMVSSSSGNLYSDKTLKQAVRAAVENATAPMQMAAALVTPRPLSSRHGGCSRRVPLLSSRPSFLPLGRRAFLLGRRGGVPNSFIISQPRRTAPTPAPLSGRHRKPNVSRGEEASCRMLSSRRTLGRRRNRIKRSRGEARQAGVGASGPETRATWQSP